MRVYLQHGFKCYIARAESGRLWGFVAIKPGHPYHGAAPAETPIRGLSWTSTAENLNRVQIPDKPTGSIGSPGDWIMGIDSECDEERMREAVECLAAMLKQNALRRPPAFIVEDFRDSVMPEIALLGMADTPERRREAWGDFLEVCVGNGVITDREAKSYGEPHGLTLWDARAFR